MTDDSSDEDVEQQLEELKTRIRTTIAGWESAKPAADSEQVPWPQAHNLITLGLEVGGITPDFAGSVVQASEARDPRIQTVANSLIEPFQQLIRWAISATLRYIHRWGHSQQTADLIGWGVRVAYPTRDLHLLTEALALQALVLRALGRLKDAVEIFEKIIRIFPPTQDIQSPVLRATLAANYTNYADVLLDLDRYDEASKAFEEAGKCATFFCTSDQLRLRVAQARLDIVLANYDRAHAAYQDVIHQLEKTDEGNDGDPLLLAEALRNDSQVYLAEHRPQQALELAMRAYKLFTESGTRVQRLMSASHLATCAKATGDRLAAQEAFTAANDLADSHARKSINSARYAAALRRAREHQTPADHKAWKYFNEGMAAQDLESAATSLSYANFAAQECDDEMLRLVALGYRVRVHMTSGDLQYAGATAIEVCNEARYAELAAPEVMALDNLALLMMKGYSTYAMATGPLGALTRASILQQLADRLCTELGLEGKDRDWWAGVDDGAVSFHLAMLADEFGAAASDPAMRFLNDSIAKARALCRWDELTPRLSHRLATRVEAGDAQGIQTTLAELRNCLARPEVSARSRALAHRAVAQALQARGDDVEKVIAEYQASQGEFLDHLAVLPPGPDRADAVRESQANARQLESLFHRLGRDREAFASLQYGKARRLFEAACARKSAADKRPRDVGEITVDLEHLHSVQRGRPTVLVDLAVSESLVTAYVLSSSIFRVIEVPVAIGEIAGMAAGDIWRREANIVAACLRRDDLRELIERVDNEIPSGAAVLVAPDGVLNNLPLHLVPCGGAPWAEQRLIGYLPCASFLHLAAQPRPWRQRSLVVGDSCDDLPGAAAECGTVAEYLDGSRPLIGAQACQYEDLANQLADGQFDVVHLAVHGRGDIRRGDRGGIRLTGLDGKPSWVNFSSLIALQWDAELVTFSGCSTGVSGPRFGQDMVGVARSVLEAGVPTVLASLWPVDDDIARIFMIEFYRFIAEKRSQGAVDLREAMSSAQRAVRDDLTAKPTYIKGQRRDGGLRMLTPDPAGAAEVDGDETILNDPAVRDGLAWAPFILLGDCMFGAPTRATSTQEGMSNEISA